MYSKRKCQFLRLSLGFAHRLHLVVCNSLGLWIRKKKKLRLLSDTTALGSESGDSDEEDLTDDVLVTSPSLSRRRSIGQKDKSEELSNIEDETMSIDDGTMSIDSGDGDDAVLDENRMEEGSDDLDIDAIDNWSRDVLEEFDP